MKNVVLILTFLFQFCCPAQKVINKSFIVNKWEVSSIDAHQVGYKNVSLNSNHYNYNFFENGTVNLFHTDVSVLEKFENLSSKCGNQFLNKIQSLPKIKITGKWKIVNKQILKIKYSYKGKVFTRKMKINFQSKAYLDVELLNPKFEFN